MTLTSGVPEESHLGPILFIIFINDIISDKIPHVWYLLYADDLKIFTIVDSSQDAHKLQLVINNIVKWCEINDMSLNTDKCKLISFVKRNVIHSFD